LKRLLAIVVNHRSGAFCARCVESLRRSWALEGRAPADLVIVVVDTASGPAEEPWLTTIEKDGAQVVRSLENLGYAGGMIAGYRQALLDESEMDGRHDAVALLNPDLHFQVGSISPLLEELERDPSCGAVGPRMAIDEEASVFHPRLELPHVAAELSTLQARFDRSQARTLLARRARMAAAFLSFESAREVPMLSGACIVMRRETVEALGEPLDGAYPLYYEDAQLAQDLRAMGQSSKIVPSSKVLHHWSRSAGSGAEFAAEPARRAAISRKLFHARHGEALAVRSLKETEEALAAAELEPPFDVHALGAQEGSFSVHFEAQEEVLLELSACPFFPLAAGVVTSGDSWSLSEALWGWIFPGRWYLRAACARTGRHLGAWSFDKGAAARVEPVSLGYEDAEVHILKSIDAERSAA
jgi:GT2 family glycosyltransferase